MTPNRLVLVPCLLLALAAPAGAQEAPDLASLFSHRAPISVDGDGLARLALPAEVLVLCRSDLSDLRVVDGDGREVPYVVESGPTARAPVEIREAVSPELLGADRREVRPDDAPPRRVETLRIAAPTEPPDAGGWELVLRSDARSFVQRLDVSAEGPDGETTPLVTEASVFRLPDPLRERLRVPLPPLPPDSRALVVRLEGEGQGYLTPRLLLEAGRRFDPEARVDVELAEVDRKVAEGRTVVVLERPRGLVPDSLRIETSTPSFRRAVEAWDEGSGSADVPLGRTTLWRIEAAETVEDTSIAIGAARGDRLRLVIEDRDSPPLADLRVVAVLREPAILFDLPGDDRSAGRLLFGGGRAFAPSYDLAALLPSRLPVLGEEAERTRLLVDPELLAEARLGEISENPAFDPRPALAFAMRPGAEVDAAAWSHRRALQVDPSTEGLARWTLHPEDLAVLRADLADLRVVDGEDRQWAFLAEERTEDLILPLGTEDRSEEPGETRIGFRLPSSPATLSLLALETTAPFFDRPYELWGAAPEGEARRLAEGRLVRPPGDPRPLRLPVPAERLESLELRIDDGSDAPLVFTGARGHFPVPDVYLPAPAGTYHALLGHPEAEAPRYELARVRGLVLSAASTSAAAGPLEENPDHRRRSRWLSGSGRQQLLLWAALLLAVGVLAGLTLRLAREGDPGDSGDG